MQSLARKAESVKPEVQKGSRGRFNPADTLAGFFGTVMGSATQQNLAEAARHFHAAQFGKMGAVPPQRQTKLFTSLLDLCAQQNVVATA